MPRSRFFAVDRSVAILTSFVYFVQGALTLSAVAFPLFLRREGWNISEIATLSFVAGLPWTLKILYGALSDGVPIGRLRRKPYVAIASIASFGAWGALALLPHDRELLYILALLANLGFAVTDVVTDAVVVEHSTEGTVQVYQSLSWGFRSFGAILGGALGGWLASLFPYRWVFGATALLPLMTLGASLVIRELPRERGGPSEILRSIVESFKVLFKGDLKWFSLLLLVESFSASFSTPFFFFLKEKLGFAETFLGLLTSIGWLGAIIGCFFYGGLLRNFSLKRMLRWAIWLNAMNVLSTYLILNRMSALTLFFLGGVIGYLTLLPMMATAALLAREKGIEGSLFALLMSVHNLGQLLSVFIGGRLFDIIGLGPLIGLSAAVGLGGLFLVSQLRTV